MLQSGLGGTCGATIKEAIHELNNWLNFLQLCVKQWGRFMLDVKILRTYLLMDGNSLFVMFLILFIKGMWNLNIGAMGKHADL
jgi:hypothetical protein